MLLRFCQAANLRAMLTDKTLPSGSEKWYPIMEKKLKGLYQGTLDRDLLYLDDSTWSMKFSMSRPDVSLQERHLIREKAPHVPLNAVLIGVTVLHGRGRRFVPSRSLDFTTDGCTKVTIDSCVHYKLPNVSGIECSGDGVAQVGRIEKIVSREGPDIKDGGAGAAFLFVRPFEALREEDRTIDPYTKWGQELQCGLVYDRFSDVLHVLLVSDLLGPVVLCPFQVTDGADGLREPCLVALRLQ